MPADAGEWRIQPRLTVSESFTDNVRLEDSGEDSDFITEITPGINVSGIGRRLRLYLDYEAQSLYFADESDANNIRNRLNASANAELVEDWFFLDASSQVSQQNLDSRGRISLDNFNISDNRGDVGYVRLSPYLRHDFGTWMTALVRANYARTEFEGSASDSENTGGNVDLSSGRRFGALSWRFSYAKDDLDRETADDVRFERVYADLRYRLSPRFSLLVQGGEEENDFQSTTQAFENGSYWAAGAFWRVSRFLGVEAVHGSRYQSATVTVTPGRRTFLDLGYRDRDVGVNPGAVWRGSLTHRTRRSTWRAEYFEDTTTTQQLLLQPVLQQNPETGELEPVLVFDETTNTVYGVSTRSLVNDVLERRRWSLSSTYRTAKTSLGGSLYRERLDRLTSDTREDIRGANGSLVWRFGARSNAGLTVGLRHHLYDGGDQDFAYVTARLTRNIRPRMGATLEYRRAQQEFSTRSSEDYTENRLYAKLVMRF